MARIIGDIWEYWAELGEGGGACWGCFVGCVWFLGGKGRSYKMFVLEK